MESRILNEVQKMILLQSKEPRKAIFGKYLLLREIMIWTKVEDDVPTQDGHYLACLTFIDGVGRQRHKIKVCRFDSLEEIWWMGPKPVQVLYWGMLPKPPEGIYE